MSDDVMQVAEVCAVTGATRKALRGYEELGLLSPPRAANGYRIYTGHHVRLVQEIRQLNELGIPLTQMRPFIDCLNSGSEHADSCPATLSEYRRAIERIDQTLAVLSARREALVANLSVASRRMVEGMRELDAANPNLVLPAGLPEPADDGAAEHLPEKVLPSLVLPATDGTKVDLGDLGQGRVLIYVFPMTGAPDQDMPDGWDAIPGARGCSAQNCDIRNHYADLLQAGVRKVFGLSSQPVDYQRQLADVLRLPYPLLTDESLHLAQDPGLPTFNAAGLTLYRRQALLVTDGIIEHVFYPVFPPDKHAETVLNWLADNPASNLGA
ncbi:MAG TPA: redoxin family protein [Micromonosporaceae bacterium]|nr:redoxin family protein [Micromonosporaceae bacterium]